MNVAEGRDGEKGREDGYGKGWHERWDSYSADGRQPANVATGNPSNRTAED